MANAVTNDEHRTKRAEEPALLRAKNPSDPTGCRLWLRYSVELHYDVSGPSEFLLNVHAARTPQQRVIEELMVIAPDHPAELDEDPATGNRITALHATSGSLDILYSSLVEVVHRVADPDELIAETPSTLPARTWRFLFPSRYCQADLVQQRTWDRFGGFERGYDQVRGVRDWVQQNIEFKVGVSGPSTSAMDTLRDGAGACRDLAHVMITFCRALNYPARYVTGVDYGADPELGPPDFHAYVEVFIGGAWYLFDPTGISPLTGLIRIGTGRDAAEVSFATIFGPARGRMPKLEFSAVDDPEIGLAAPVHTDLAVSTAR